MVQPTLLAYFKPPTNSQSPRDSRETHNNASDIQQIYPPTGDALTGTGQEPRKVSVQSLLAPDVFSPQLPDESRIRYSRIEAIHIGPLKRLTASILPVRYPSKFFEETLTDTTVSSLSRVVHYDDRPVGWIRCRLEPATSGPTGTVLQQIYIQALCILAPYRNYGYATHLVEGVLQPQALTENNVVFVYAHVWENNEDALAWYERRGFKRIMLVEKYYNRLVPSGAWIVRRDVG
jgi:N-alpha-acetyltransferase 50